MRKMGYKGKERLIFHPNYIKVNNPFDSEMCIMHRGEYDLSVALAQKVTSRGGDILEVGFGLNMTADEIQKNKNVKSHTIIEIHPEIYKRALKWAEGKKNVEIILGDWYDMIPNLNKKFDGIMVDTHEDEKLGEFLEICKKVCSLNCMVVFWGLPPEYLELNIFNSTPVSVKEEDIEKMPYSHMFDFKNWELKDTYFNGEDFVRQL
jgi:hypothetical protein